jgi:hypothetical protein
VSSLDDIRKKFLKTPEERDDINLLACAYCYVCCLSERSIREFKLHHILCPNCGKRCLVDGSGGSKPISIRREDQGWTLAKKRNPDGKEVTIAIDPSMSMDWTSAIDMAKLDVISPEEIKRMVDEMAVKFPSTAVTVEPSGSVLERMRKAVDDETRRAFEMPPDFLHPRLKPGSVYFDELNAPPLPPYVIQAGAIDPELVKKLLDPERDRYCSARNVSNGMLCDLAPGHDGLHHIARRSK